MNIQTNLPQRSREKRRERNVFLLYACDKTSNMATSVGEVHCEIVRYTCNSFIPQSGTVFVSASTGKLPVLNGTVPVPA